MSNPRFRKFAWTALTGITVTAVGGCESDNKGGGGGTQQAGNTNSPGAGKDGNNATPTVVSPSDSDSGPVDSKRPRQ